MLKIIVSYSRYTLSLLSTVGFSLALN